MDALERRIIPWLAVAEVSFVGWLLWPRDAPLSTVAMALVPAVLLAWACLARISAPRPR